MKRVLFALLATAAFSASAQNITTRDVAQVTGVQPLTEQVRQPGRCYQVQGQRQQQGPNVGMSILAGVVGGAVGSRIGQGDGRDAAIAAGAGLGAVWGAGQPQAQQGGQQQCEPDGVTERIRGYRVTYTYQGYTGTTTVGYQPGPTIPVVITVSPDSQQGGGQQGYQQQNYQQQGYQQQNYQQQGYQGPDHPAQRF